MKNLKLFENFKVNENYYRIEDPEVISIAKNLVSNLEKAVDGPIEYKDLLISPFDKYQGIDLDYTVKDIILGNPFLKDWFIDYGKEAFGDDEYNILDSDLYQDFWDHIDEIGYGIFESLDPINEYNLQKYNEEEITDVLVDIFNAVAWASILNFILYRDPSTDPGDMNIKPINTDVIMGFEGMPVIMSQIGDSVEGVIKKALDKTFNS